MRFVFIVLLLWAANLSAQSNVYAGQQNRVLKALSDSDIHGYLNGMGMGMAKAAELNHFPGPKHVLDLAAALELSPDQIGKTEQLFNQMKKEAIPLGKKLVEAERELNRLFSEGTVNEENLMRQLQKISTLQSRLRYVHLQAHLEQKRILSPRQTAQYDILRGYHEKNARSRNSRKDHKCG